MRTILTVVATVVAVMWMSNTASAGGNCSGNACDAAHWATKAPAVGGPKAPTRQRMACIRVITYGKTEVIWTNGRGDEVPTSHPMHYTNAPVIWKQRANGAHYEYFPLHQGWVVTESCIDMRRIQNLRYITVCNGTVPNVGYHWSFTQREMAQLKRTGHLTSYVPFLEVADRNRFSKQAVTRAYQARY